MISFDFHHLGAFFRPELSRFPPCLPSFEGAILDSKLENVGPTLSSLLCADICVKYDTAPLKCHPYHLALALCYDPHCRR